MITNPGTERIARLAFEYARANNKKKVTVVTKANVVKATDGKFLDICKKVSGDYPEIEMDDWYIDIMTAKLIDEKRRGQFEVFILPNLYGDILTDEASVITGSLGMLPSASIGIHTSVFEPIHGSYPQAAGKNIANPLATILSAALMFEYAFNAMSEGALIREAVAASMSAGIVTEDIARGGKIYSTSEVGDWIAQYIAGN
ncbi:3-isopropylmalate dehydrogenase [bioreactor metagenome]|uniref:3-isopropylmalate dehydrogenase n=1 Tax=bioreactor metagenome TaxID=1076179 RepID=A0A645HUV2_9ZZZZ